MSRKPGFQAVSSAVVPTEATVNCYAAFLRLARPTKPSRPEPKSQTAAGTGTAVELSAAASDKVGAYAIVPPTIYIPTMKSETVALAATPKSLRSIVTAFRK